MADRKIAAVMARQVWDSRGRPTVEAEVTLTSGTRGRSIAPAGASRGAREAIDLRDGGARLGGMGVNKAIEGINTRVNDALNGQDAIRQGAIDATLIELDGTAQKSVLGGNACVAVSSAVAWAAAAEQRIPLWRHLNNMCGEQAPEPAISTPMIQIFGGGAHAGNRVDIQDFMVICNGASSFAEATEWTAEIYMAGAARMKSDGRAAGVCDEGGLWPEFTSNEAVLECLSLAIEQAGFRLGEQVSIALDVAASEFLTNGKYALARDDVLLTTEQLIDMLERWCATYPIVSIEDPLGEDDLEGFAEITRRLGDKTQIVGDDLLTTSAAQIRKAGEAGAGNTALLKSNQCGTLSEVMEASHAARLRGWNTVMSGRSGESEDVTLSHLAVGLGADQIKVGSMTRSERTCKWNEMIRIEALQPSIAFAGFALPQ